MADGLQVKWAEQGDLSYDPYDGLTARRVPRALCRTRTTRLAQVQLHKRLPFNLRAAFGIPTTKNAYAVAHFASACLRLDHLGMSPTAGARASERLDWLQSARIRGGWGYPFDVQTKTFHYSRTTPNVICTAFAVNAFLDATELTDHVAALSVAADGVEFILSELLVARGGDQYFAYLPGEKALIHNANALAAASVVRFAGLADRPELVGIALRALAPTLAAIRPDGSLLYGEGPSLGWVDGHHTGFVIQALTTVARSLPQPDAALEAAVVAMVRYYRDELFGADGWPYQRPRSPYPIDTIAGAQGILTFAMLGDQWVGTAGDIASFMIERMRLPSGSFGYLRWARHMKAIPYSRWADAPMCLALAVLATAISGKAGR